MKRRIFSGMMALVMLLVLVIGMPVPAQAAGGSSYYGGTKWKLDEEGTMTITGSGEWELFGWSKYKDQVKKVVIEEGITNIPIVEFRGLPNLTTVEIAGSVKVIGERAFEDCPALTDVILSEGLEEIGSGAFGNCTSLRNIQLPNSLIVISNAFYDCTSLTSMEIPYGVYELSATFSGCTALKEVTIPVTVGALHGGVFSDCTALETVYYTGTEYDWLRVEMPATTREEVPVRCLGTEKNPDLQYDYEILDGPYAYRKEQIVLPDFAQDFYDWLVESTDWDGVEDVLLDAAMADPFEAWIYREYELSVPAAAQCASENERSRLLQQEAYAACEAIEAVSKIIVREDRFTPIVSTYANSEILTDGSNRIKITCEVFLSQITDKDAYLAERDRWETAVSKALVAVPEGSIYEQVKGFNEYLTKINGYNSLYPDNPDSSYLTITALEGHYGSEGPVCQAYALAFKELCDRRNIPCVYVSGMTNGGPHGWNYVKMEDGKWYAVDVTWNDPLVDGTEDTPVSGYECETYLLDGSESFNQSHIPYDVDRGDILEWEDPVLSKNDYGEPEKEPSISLVSVLRVYGDNRYDTAFAASGMLRDLQGGEKFENIVVACGTDFADALSGSYLANQKNAPILLIRNNNREITDLKTYIKNNLVSGGTVYLLGGTNAVPKSMETGLDGFNVKRLAGATRYETSLAIIQEAGVGDNDILVCTGKNFADGLSASAVNKPILLVKDSLSASQKAFLDTVKGSKFYIIGGTAAVNTRIENELKVYGTTERIEGATRYYTSVNIARKFFPDATCAVLAYADNFPDGLSGGPLAYSLKAPLILTMSGKQSVAVNYAKEMDIRYGVVLGGSTLISDKIVRAVFQLPEDYPIMVVR